MKLAIVTAEKVRKPEQFLVTQASILGLKAGQPWPHALETTLGDQQPFLFIHNLGEDGMLYKQESGYIFLLVELD